MREMPRIAGVSSFGAGGANAHVVIEEYVAPTAQTHDVNSPALVILSARNEDRLLEQVRLLMAAIAAPADIALADLAYTLQIGREAMEERLALIAHSVDDLRAKLSGIAAGATGLDDVFRGQVKRHREALGMLAADADMARTMETWAGRGKFDKLLDMWVKGLGFDWRKLYGANKPRRISLPSYPFARERYWIQPGGTEQPAQSARAALLHPLLHRNTSDLSGLRFSSHLSGEEFFLADHVVRGARILPGVAQLEMACSAVREMAGENCRIALQDITWIRPVVVGPEGMLLHIALHADEESDIAFEIYSDGNDGETLTYSQGWAAIVADDELDAGAAHDLAAIREQCDRAQWSAEACYAAFARAGLQYGPGFQGLADVLIGRDQVLARIALPSTLGIHDDLQRYRLHPSLLDAALQASLALLADGSEVALHLPFSLGALEEFGPCLPDMWALVRRSPGCAAGDAVQRLDIDLCDQAGAVRVRFKDFSMRGASEGGAMPGTEKSAARDRELLLMPVWDVVNNPAVKNVHVPTERAVMLGGTPVQQAAILAQFPQSAVLGMASMAQIADIEQSLRTHGQIDHLVWIVGHDGAGHLDDEALIAAQQQGVVLGFRLIKALLALGFDQRALRWSVITCDTQAVHGCDEPAPAHAGVHGFVGSMAKEFRRWQVRLLDMPNADPWPFEQLFQLPFDADGNALAWRSGQWFRQMLQPVETDSLRQTAPLYRQGGVYVVIGGAGGIGQAWSEHMVRQYRANIVWIGRRPSDEAIEQARSRLGAFGPTPMYIAADATDHGALERARDEVLSRFPAIHGVMHAAIALLDRSLVHMDEERLRAGLAAKVDVSVRMHQVFGALPLDFMLFCSSLLSFIKAAGQSNYAAGCTFKDAYALQLAKRAPYPVKVMNWGYWGGVGVVATDVYRERMAQQGIGSIEVGEGMLAIDNLLAAPVAQLGFLKVAPSGAKGGIFDLIGTAHVRAGVARYDSLGAALSAQPPGWPSASGKSTGCRWRFWAANCKLWA